MFCLLCAGKVLFFAFCLRLVERHMVQALGLLGSNIGVLDLYSKYDVPNRISNSRSSYTFTKKSSAGANRTSTQSTKSNDWNQIPNERNHARAASTIGLRVQAYNQSTANFRLSTMPGAPRPFKARFATVRKQAAPVTITNTLPISDGTGSSRSDQSW